MYRTQLIRRDETPDIADANNTGYAGYPGESAENTIRRAVEWELSEAWEAGELDAQYDMEFVAVAVWRDTEFVGVYTMDAEEVCPEWRNLKRVDAETPGAA
jgi:hypothetical protein